MRVALLFHRPDVDAFLDEIDAEQFEEWVAFTQIEPQGWQALALQTQRLSYMTVLPHAGKRRIKERDFEHKLAGGHSATADHLRFEAMSIRTAIQAGDFEG